jgi:hypothetical protein
MTSIHIPTAREYAQMTYEDRTLWVQRLKKRLQEWVETEAPEYEMDD